MSNSIEQCRQAIISNAQKVAQDCLKAHGLSVPVAQSRQEALVNEALFSQYLNEQNNLIVAAAIWMQNHLHFSDPGIGQVAKKVANFIFREADDCFYDQGDLEIALSLYQLAAGLDADNEKYLLSVITPCIQGDILYPEVALPYAVCVASLNPNRDETPLVESLIEKKYSNGSYP